MTFAAKDRDSLLHAVFRVCEEISTMRSGPSNWQDHGEDELWHELVGCILGSRVSHERAVMALRYLRSTGLLNPRLGKCNLEEFERNIAQALSQSMASSNRNPNGWRYPYPALRANHIRRTVETIYRNGGSLHQILACSNNANDARLRIVSIATGVGPKQASLFLRNIGYAKDLAILDRHVLAYMTWLEIIPGGINEVRTLRGYERLEGAFRSHARQIGFSVAHMDLAVWVVMRVLRREFAP